MMGAMPCRCPEGGPMEGSGGQTSWASLACQPPPTELWRWLSPVTQGTP